MKIEVFLITYNRAGYLRNAITSILNQTFSDFDLIILDNCSEDNTTEVVRSFNDDRIKYVRHDKNLGGIGNINYAFEHASGDYFVVFHDDDIMMPDFLKVLTDTVVTYSDCAAVSGLSVVFDDVSCEEQLSHSERNIKIHKAGSFFREYFDAGRTFVFPTFMYRTEFIRRNDLKLKEAVGPCADVILCFDIETCGGTLLQVPKAVMKYRLHEDQDSIVNLYPMNIRMYKWLRNSEEYRDRYLNCSYGRYKRYSHLCRMLYLDWVKGKLTYKEAGEYMDKLGKQLLPARSNKWKMLFDISNGNEKIRMVEQKIYKAVKGSK